MIANKMQNKVGLHEIQVLVVPELGHSVSTLVHQAVSSLCHSPPKSPATLHSRDRGNRSQLSDWSAREERCAERSAVWVRSKKALQFQMKIGKIVLLPN